MTEKWINVVINNAEMEFTDIGGRSGQNFRLVLDLKNNCVGCIMEFNPMRLPQLLKEVGVEKFSELKGSYVQILNGKIGEKVEGLRNILSEDGDEWFLCENGIYFGSEFFKGYGDSDD